MKTSRSLSQPRGRPTFFHMRQQICGKIALYSIAIYFENFSDSLRYNQYRELLRKSNNFLVVSKCVQRFMFLIPVLLIQFRLINIGMNLWKVLFDPLVKLAFGYVKILLIPLYSPRHAVKFSKFFFSIFAYDAEMNEKDCCSSFELLDLRF